MLLTACSSRVDLEAEKKTIISMLQMERKAHFDRNVELFVSEFADSMISVNKGEVSIDAQNLHKERIGKYFDKVKFIEWDDVAEPIIRFSEDGSLAYAIIQKEVILTYVDSIGNPRIDTAHYAWSSIYRKRDSEWKIECNISTNK